MDSNNKNNESIAIQRSFTKLFNVRGQSKLLLIKGKEIVQWIRVITEQS